MRKGILLSLIVLSVVVACGVMFQHKNVKNMISGRGCCSGHGGVCGCSDGRSKCCDGSYSPSCRCFKDDVKGAGV